MHDITAGYPIVLNRRVRFGDCDPAGIVFTPNYSRYVFDACEEWLRAVLDINIAHQLQGDEVGTPVRALTTELLYPLKPGEDFTMEMRVKNIGRTSFTLEALGTSQKGHRSFIGTMTCVATIRLKRAVIALPDHYRAAMQDYQDRCSPSQAAPPPA